MTLLNRGYLILVPPLQFYNYRTVPYFGGSDYYAYVPRLIRILNNDVYPNLNLQAYSF